MIARLALATASLVLTALFIELVLRIVGFDPFGRLLHGRESVIRPSEIPRLRYELTPGAEAFAWRTQVKINSHGFRDREYPTEKGDHLRIVVLGDSVVFGNDLSLEETFPEVLESRLNNSLDRQVDVLNLGVGGYDTMQEVALLEHLGVRFGPDVVVVGYCVNDVGDATVNLTYIENLHRLESPLYRFRLAQFLQQAFDRLLLAREFRRANREDSYRERYAGEILPIDDDPRVAEWMGTLREELRLADSEGSWLGGDRDVPLEWYASPARVGRLRFALEWLSDLSMAHDFRVVVALIPYLEDRPEYDSAYRIVERLAEAQGFDVLRLDQVLRGEELAGLRIREDDPIHPNARGHELIAEGLREHLERDELWEGHLEVQ